MKSTPWFLALALAGSNFTWAEDSMGKLFFSPAQREALDAGKRIFVKRAEQSQAAPARPRVPDVAVNGVVTRSDGERTVWVNGQAFHNESPDGIRVRTDPSRPASADILIRDSNKSARLLVGQQLDVESGSVRNTKRDDPVTGDMPKAREISRRSSKMKAVVRDEEASAAAEVPDTNSGVPK
ncbi:MAG: hypothetical protein ACKVP2_14485 [Burkholderiales bacterium]